jgi:hypothetical protein
LATTADVIARGDDGSIFRSAEYLYSILRGLANFSINRIAELTLASWLTRASAIGDVQPMLVLLSVASRFRLLRLNRQIGKIVEQHPVDEDVTPIHFL